MTQTRLETIYSLVVDGSFGAEIDNLEDAITALLTSFSDAKDQEIVDFLVDVLMDGDDDDEIDIDELVENFQSR